MITNLFKDYYTRKCKAFATFVSQQTRYFVGGYEPYNNREQFRTTPLTTQGNTVGVIGHTFVTIEGVVYMNGGKTTNGVFSTQQLVSASRYSISFSTHESDVPPRYYHTACVYNNRIFVFGGFDNNNQVTDSLIVLGGSY